MKTSPQPDTSSPPQPEALHSIRAVAQLTGLSAHILRIWEKRYAAVQPARTKTQRRLYSAEDIERFTLLKTLVNHGHTISQVAPLPVCKLRELAQANGKLCDSLAGNPACVRLVICGTAWATRQKSIPLTLDGVETVAVVGTLSELATIPAQTADALLLDEPHPDLALIDHLVIWSEKLGLKRIIVIYRFASVRTLARMKKSHPALCLLRAPVSDDEIRLACVSHLPARAPVAAPVGDATATAAKSFTPAELERLANYTTSLACDCPKHLVELIRSLDSFETYSGNCSSRDAEDAALHQRLQQRTAQARTIMEAALRDLVTVERLG